MKNKNLRIILILTLVTIIFWVGFQLFKIASSSTIPPANQELIAPLDPTIDRTFLEKLKTLK